jgi:1-acyl-sn-glycerol-3-phosphate acyltransferase
MSLTYRAAARLVHGLARLFFRSIEVTGAEHLPARGGGILVSWHPNGLIDPALIYATFERRVVVGARHGLFRYPILGSVLRMLGVVPIRRAQDSRGGDPEARRLANARSLDVLAEAVAEGSWACLFPEGDSHDQPTLLELKSGAARLYYRALALAGPDADPPAIIPVGLHYNHKRTFRSQALVAYHAPVELPAELAAPPPASEGGDAHRESCRRLTAEIDRVLRETVHATESWELHHLMHRARKLVRAERAHRAGARPGRVRMEERTLGFARVWTGYRARMRSEPARVLDITRRVGEYNETLRALRIEDHELDRGPRLASPWLPLLLILQVLFVFLLLPPLLLVGYAVNAVPFLGLGVISRLLAKKRKDEATIKLVFGFFAFPLAWAAAGVSAAWTHRHLHALFPSLPDAPVLAAAVVVALGIAGGVVALQYMGMARETARAVRVRLTRARRRRSLERLRAERAELFEEILALSEGLELPGWVDEKGRVRSTPGQG